MSEDLRYRVFPVLDDGHVQLIDWMGDDGAIVDAARVSFGAGTRAVSDDRTLLRYLMRHRHATPFEMAEIKLRVRVPMDCWRQWIRHRTANVNEYSTRYSEAIDSAQRTPPTAWRAQSASNRQGSGGFLESWTGEDGGPNRWNDSPEHALDHAARLTAKIPMDVPLSPGAALSIVEADFHREAAQVYRQRLAMGVAREQARKDLPLSTYTEAYWKCDLRNVLGFLALRMDPHAQQEIRAYADVIGNEIVARLFPETWSAFRDYVLDAVTLSALDIEAARKAAVGDNPEVIFGHIANKRERAESVAKLVRLGLVSEPVKEGA